MFGRELKTKIPELRREKSQLDEAIRDLDWRNKLVGKAKADDHRGAKPSTVEVGGQILLKNTKEQGKLASKYESSPYTLLPEKKGEN